MEFIRKHKKASLIILTGLIIFMFFGFTVARYMYNNINNYILESKGFYFNSSVLSLNTSRYSVNNWDGVNSYVITIDVNNKKNELKSTTSDINYDITVDCPSTVRCTISKNNGTIYEATKTDSYTITVDPQSNFYAGDTVVIKTTASSTYPYKKSISAEYTIGVEKSNFTYNIEDSIGSKFLTLNLTNSVSYYEVSESFTANNKTYPVGEQVSIEEYNSLTDTNQEKCFSAIVKLTFSPNNIYLDITSQSYYDRIQGSTKTTNINGFPYVSEYSFKIKASTSEKILFYKENIDNNFTYPIINASPIVNVTVETAN